MKFLIPILAASLVTAASGAAVSHDPVKPVHAASFSDAVLIAPTVMDLGSVAVETTAKASLTLLNPTDHPIVISGVKPKCGCTTVPLPDDRVLAPHATMTLPISIDAPKTPKLKTVGATVLFENHPPLVVSMVLDAVAEVDASVERVQDAPLSVIAPEFRVDRADEAGVMHGQVWVVNTSDESVVLEAVKASCGCTSVDFTEALALTPGGAELLSVSMTVPKAGELERAEREARSTLRKVMRCTVGDGRVVDLPLTVVLSPDA